MEVPLLVACLFWLGVGTGEVIDYIRNFEFVKNRVTVSKRKYRPRYHISSPMGWVSHPAGFTFFHRQYHVFYQYHPYDGSWGSIQWGHAVSKNLVDWQHYPAAIVPREPYENKGCLSGTALVDNNYLTVFYTGCQGDTCQNQAMAISSDGLIFQKYLLNPFLKPPVNAYQAFKNPKVWKRRRTWYMLCGVKTRMGLGAVVLFTSTDMVQWQLNGTVAESYGDMGSQWESPDFFELDGVHVLVLSARGIRSFENRNLYQTGYVTGKFNYRSCRFNDYFEVSEDTFNALDHGHDFYAAQTMLSRDGRRLLVAWLGMWKSPFYEASDGWASMLTIVRELRFFQGQLFMEPVRETRELRADILEDASYLPGESFDAGCKTFELIINASYGAKEVSIRMKWRGGSYSINYNAKKGKVSVDRGGEDGVRRADWDPAGTASFQIFVDRSSVEVFCGRGEVVFSSRIYPKDDIRVHVSGDKKVHVAQYRLRPSIGFGDRVRKRVVSAPVLYRDDHTPRPN